MKDTLVFMPFSYENLKELRTYISQDTSPELIKSFGKSIFLENSTNINFGFISQFHSPENMPGIHSMSVTIKTSYKKLINIGFIQILVDGDNQNWSTIKHLYIFKPFRRKDYEFMALRKGVEFSFNELKCERCFIWVSEENYLYLAIVRTASFHLIKTVTNSNNGQIYCFMYCKEPKTKLSSNGQSIIAKPSQINKTPNKIQSLNNSSNWDQTSIFDQLIPDYQDFKNKLDSINRVHAISNKFVKTPRRTAIYYSPIIKPESSRKIKNPRENIDFNTPQAKRQNLANVIDKFWRQRGSEMVKLPVIEENAKKNNKEMQNGKNFGRRLLKIRGKI